MSLSPEYYITKNGYIAEDKTALTLIHELIHGYSAISTGVPVGDPSPNATDADFNNPTYDMRGFDVNAVNVIASELAASNPTDWNISGTNYSQGSYYVSLDQAEMDDNEFTVGQGFTFGSPIDQVRLASASDTVMDMTGRGAS